MESDEEEERDRTRRIWDGFNLLFGQIAHLRNQHLKRKLAYLLRHIRQLAVLVGDGRVVNIPWRRQHRLTIFICRPLELKLVTIALKWAHIITYTRMHRAPTSCLLPPYQVGAPSVKITLSWIDEELENEWLQHAADIEPLPSLEEETFGNLVMRLPPFRLAPNAFGENLPPF